MQDTKLTASFKLSEFLATKTGLPNIPPSGSEVYSNLLRLATMLQKIRDYIDQPIIINSGYRSPAVNKAVGGANNSSHMYGLAADIRTSKHNTIELAHLIENSGVAFDKLIIEPTWVHIQVAMDGDESNYRIMYAILTKGKPASYHDGYPPAELHYEFT